MLKKLDLKDYYDLHAYLILKAINDLYGWENKIKLKDVQYYQLGDEEYLYYNNIMHEITWDEGIYYVCDDIGDENKIWDYHNDELGVWEV